MEEEYHAPEVSEKELEIVIDILRTLSKTVKTFNVYPKDNPIYQKFAAEIFGKFNTFFELSDELPLHIEQYSLLYKGNKVFYSEERTDSIPLLLFADGLRQIVFHKDISPEEITDFIDILRFAPKSATSDDDDIVTLLWEKNIRNMGYTAVEDTVDDRLAIEESHLQEPAVREDIQSPEAGGPHYPGPAASFFSSQPGIEPLTDTDIEAISGELSSLEEAPLLSSAVELFYELLSVEKDSEAFPEIMQALGKILEIRMKKEGIGDALRILGRLKDISAVYQDPVRTGLIKNVFLKAGNPENISLLFRGSAKSDDITQYLLFLDVDSIPHLVSVLAELQDRKQRRLLCEILAGIVRKNIDALSGALQDNRWYLVRNIAMILGMTKEAAAVKHLEGILKHSEPRVRREAVKALAGIDSGDTKKLFLTAMDDEDLTIRISGLRSLRRFKDSELFRILSARASREKLKKISFEEKKELLETLAALDGKSAFSLLSELFRKKRFIETDEMVEIRVSASYGLGVVGTPEAVALLQEGAASKRRPLRETCLKVLKGLQ